MKLSARDIQLFAQPITVAPALLILGVYSWTTAVLIGTLLGRGDMLRLSSILTVGWGVFANVGALWIIRLHITARRIQAGSKDE
jgi:hypothetical protein